MSLHFDFDYRLRWMDFDRYGRLHPFAVFDMCQDLATVHAEQMGIGRDDMLRQGVIWVVVRQKYEVVSPPRHFQKLLARTWPHSPSRFSFQRDFSFRDEQGNEIVKATSEWVLMNVESRKFASMKDVYEPADEYDSARAFERKPRKIHAFEEGNRPVVQIVPSYSDIDLNGHVNNARYANYIVEALRPDEHECIRSLQIDYRYEVVPGEPLAMHTLVEDAMVRSKGVREDGTVAFTGAIELG